MDLIFGAVLPHDDLIENRGNQCGVDARFKTQFLVQFPADGIDVQFLGACSCLLLPDGSQLGFLTLQLIVQSIVSFLKFLDGDRTGDVQIQQPIFLDFGGSDLSFCISNHLLIVHFFGNIH